MLAQLSRFLQVGAVGYLIDAGLLWMLVYGLGVLPVPARVVSFMTTISVAFVLNARYTFNVAPKRSLMPRYGLIQSLGALLNFGSYTWLVSTWQFEPIFSLSVGAVLGSTHNFLMMRVFVFKGTGQKANESTHR